MPTEHPIPPPKEALPAPESYSTIDIPAPASTATLAQLHALREAQERLFEAYRVQYDDEFVITVLGHPEWTTEVTVLRDGNIYVGFLGRSVFVHDLTFEEIAKRLVFGVPALQACGNCGHAYAPGGASCPVCGASRDNRLGSARLTLSATVRTEIERLGGILAPPDKPIRWIGTDAAVLLARDGLVRVAVPDTPLGAATVTWVRSLGVLVIDAGSHAAEGLPDPVPVRVGQRWMLLDRGTGTLKPDTEGVARHEAVLAPRPEPNGLNVYFKQPRVKIEKIKQAPTSYTVKVVGAVSRGGRVRIQVGFRIWDAITDAGGPVIRGLTTPLSIIEAPTDPTIDWSKAVLLREARFLPTGTIPAESDPTDLVRVRIDFVKLAQGDSRQNVPLFPGDVVYIPEYVPNATAVTVVGEVYRPGLFYYRDHIDLMQAMARAGWADEVRAKTSGVYLVRKSLDDETKRRVYIIHLEALARGLAPNLPLQDGDFIYVDTDWLTDVGDVIDKINPFFNPASTWGIQSIAGWDEVGNRLRTSGN